MLIAKANILITKGVIKLADFGIAIKTNQQAGNVPVAMAPVGSPYWMAPEVLGGDPVTPACDIWAVGVTAIELLTGKPPYFDMKFPQYKIVHDEYPPKETLRKIRKCPASKGLEAFLRLCLVKNPSRRQSAEILQTNKWLVSHTTMDTKKKKDEEIDLPDALNLTKDISTAIMANALKRKQSMSYISKSKRSPTSKHSPSSSLDSPNMTLSRCVTASLNDDGTPRLNDDGTLTTNFGFKVPVNAPQAGLTTPNIYNFMMFKPRDPMQIYGSKSDERSAERKKRKKLKWKRNKKTEKKESTKASTMQSTEPVSSDWSVGQKCDIYISRRHKWIKAEIIDIFNDDEGDWVKVRFGRNYKDIKPDSSKIRSRMDSGNDENDSDQSDDSESDSSDDSDDSQDSDDSEHSDSEPVPTELGQSDDDSDEIDKEWEVDMDVLHSPSEVLNIEDPESDGSDWEVSDDEKDSMQQYELKGNVHQILKRLDEQITVLQHLDTSGMGSIPAEREEIIVTALNNLNEISPQILGQCIKTAISPIMAMLSVDSEDVKCTALKTIGIIVADEKQGQQHLQTLCLVQFIPAIGDMLRGQSSKIKEAATPFLRKFCEDSGTAEVVQQGRKPHFVREMFIASGGIGILVDCLGNEYNNENKKILFAAVDCIHAVFESKVWCISVRV